MVKEDFRMDYKNLTEIPVQFYHLDGQFYCSVNKLVSLKSSPISMKTDFHLQKIHLFLYKIAQVKFMLIPGYVSKEIYYDLMEKNIYFIFKGLLVQIYSHLLLYQLKIKNILSLF